MYEIRVNKTGDYPDCIYYRPTFKDALSIANHQRKAICDSVEIYLHNSTKLLYKKQIGLDGNWKVVKDLSKIYLQIN